MFVHTVIMVIEPHMKQGRQHKLISTIFLATSVTKKLDHNSFINGEEKRLAFFFVKIGDLFLDSLEHPGFAAFFRNSKNEAKLLVKVSNADGGETQVFHMEQAWI